MKYKTLIFAFTLIAAQSLCTTSCGDDEYFNEHSHYGITTANSGLQIGGSLVLDIDAQKASWQDHITAYNSIKYLNMTWSTSGLPTWINQTPLSGGGYDYGADNIDYTIAENKSNNARSAVVTYEGISTFNDGYTRSDYCTFNQKGTSTTWGSIKCKYLSEYTELYFSGRESTYSFLVTGNGTITIDSPSWIHFETTRVEPEYNETEGTFSTVEVNAKIDANPYNSNRTGYIRIYINGYQKDYLTIHQNEAQTSVDVTRISMPRNASSQKINVNSDKDWKAAITQKALTKGDNLTIIEADWLSVTPKEGSVGKTGLNINTTDNTELQTRTAYVAICNTNNVVENVISVEQAKSYVKPMGNPEISADMRGGECSIQLGSNTDWWIYQKPDWINVDKGEGKGDATIKLNIKPNDNKVERTGYIVVLPKCLQTPLNNIKVDMTSEVQAVYAITQSGPSIDINKSDVLFDGNAGSQSISVKADAPWTLNKSAEDDWLTVTPMSGNGDATITISAAENNTRGHRVATLTLKMGQQSKTIAVAQTSKYISLGQDAMQFNSKSNNWVISVKSSSKWTVEVPKECSSWVKASATNGNKDQDVTLTIADNPSANERSAEVLITLDDGQVVVAKLVQQGRYLRLPFSTVQIFAEGGNKTVNIDSDGKISYEKSDSWFNITPGTTANSFVISADKNTTKKMRQGTIRFWLSDITDGTKVEATLRITQATDGNSFTIEGYGDDTNFNGSSNNSQVTITIGKGYTNDQNFN